MSVAGRARLAEAAILALMAVVAGWPLLVDEGWASYLDHAVHLAELEARARHGGYLDAVSLGIDFTYVHSPFWYGGLAWLVRAGAPALPLYLGAVLASLASQGLAAWWVARPRVGGAMATALGASSMLLPSVLRGYASVLGGMWTFGLAAAALVLLTERLGRDEEAPTDVAAIGLFTGLVGLSHLFGLYALMALFGMTAALRLARGEIRRVRQVALGAALGALVSAGTWLTAFLVLDRDAQALTNPDLASTLVSIWPGPLEPDEAVWVLALGLAPGLVVLAPAALSLATPRALLGRDLGGALAVGTFAALAAAMLAVAGTDSDVLGPVSYRLAGFARPLLVLPAAAWLAARPGLVAAASRLPRALAAPALLAAAALASWPLGAQLDGGAHRAGARVCARALASLHPEGRVFAGASADRRDRSRALRGTYVATAALREVRLPSVGAYYDHLPSRAWAWTNAYRGRLLGARVLTAAQLDGLADRMSRAAISHLLVTDPRHVAALDAHAGFTRVAAEGDWVAFASRTPTRWAWLEDPARGPLVARREGDGRFSLSVTLDAPSTLVVSTGFHPWLALEGAPRGAYVAPRADGLTEIRGLPRGRATFALVFRPHHEAWALSALGALALVGAYARGARQRTRMRGAVSQPSPLAHPPSDASVTPT